MQLLVLALEVPKPLPLISREACTRTCVNLSAPTHLRSVSVVMPHFAAIELIAAHCEG